MDIKALIIISVALWPSVFSANILAILPTSIPSHLSTFKFLLKALAEEHNVFFYGVPLKMNHENITEKRISMYTDSYLSDFSDSIFKSTCKKSGFEVLINEVLWLNYPFFNKMFTGNDIQELIKSNSTFDLMITIGHTSELFFPFADKFNIPLVQFATSVPLPWSNEAIGNPNFFASDISFITFESPTNIAERLKKFVKHYLVMAHYKWRFLPFINKIAMQYFPSGTSSVQESAKRTALLLMNYQSKMGYSRTNIPTAIEIGGLHCTSAKALPPDLEEFMESSGSFGVIYFSLGSTIRGVALPENIRKEILQVFSKLPQKVLWKWEGNMTDLPPNVKISKWLPQQDILGHKKTRLFITQGGMLSVQEAAYHGVPLLVIPLMLDQHTNAAIIEQNGYGLKVDFCQFSQDEFFTKITKFFQDPKYHQTVKEISSSIKDSRWTPSEKIKWWIGYILRHKTTSNLRPPNNMSWFQYSELDVYFIITFITVISIYFAYVILTLLIKNIKNITSTASDIKLKEQ